MVQVLDSTLREGEQTAGVFFDSHIKLTIAELLDQVGIDIIEAGHPRVSQDIYSAVKLIAQGNFNAVIGAHARSLRQDVDLALDCGVGFLGIFFSVSQDRLNDVFKKKLSVAIDQISQVIAYAREQNPALIIRYTPEDGVRSKFQNVVEASVAAVQAGADIISVADTTGYMLPGTSRSMYDFVSKLKDALADRDVSPKIAVHCHNDRGFALANALDAYRAGAEIIDASVLGLGERAGIVDLAQLLSALHLDFGEDNAWDFKRLPELYRTVSQYSGVPIPVNFPLIGAHAFTHCAGVHTHAAAKNPLHYQSISPEFLGREMDVALDHMSGLSSVKWAFEKIGAEVDDDLALRVLEVVKSIGQRGRTVGLEELPQIIKLCRMPAEGEVQTGTTSPV
ncbi:MAG: 2-isopropylmalate synthase [Candidatus Marinimicrobia bacterium]|nr:2-isopropylmalate synthase [Candidatus Neomarinimicrobiota bacterium]